MRNPIRLKNLRPRLLPYVLLGLAIVWLRPPTQAGLALGLPLVAAGAALRGWAAGHLVKSDALTTTGPYAHLRHPLYLGTLLVATGFAVVLGGLRSVALLAVIWPWFAFHYFPRKDRTECARLASLHGEAFERYRAAVPALLPRLRAWGGEGVGAGVSSAGEATRWRLSRYSENNELGTALAIVAAVAFFGWRAGWGGP